MLGRHIGISHLMMSFLFGLTLGTFLSLIVLTAAGVLS
jgi:hypothetical protein